MKTNIGLVEYCKAQLGKPYWYGTFGNIASEKILRSKSIQYPKFYTDDDYMNQYGERVHDCVGLIKGYLWSDTPTATPTYNVLQDKNVSGMYKNCDECGYITTIPEIKGVLVFKNTSHVGIYIGNGKVIEARGHEYGVVETDLEDRNWTHWGMLNWIEYIDEKQIKMFQDGDELKAIDYLVYVGEVTNKELALMKLETVVDEKWTYIKWANIAKKLYEQNPCASKISR